VQIINQIGKPGHLIASSDIAVARITALWALSESLLGGILHGMHIPFRGLIIASASVLFISIIFFYSKNPSQILKAGLLVILIKLTVSPHTPVMAFIAVAYQTLLGYLFFRFIHSYKVAAVFFSVIVLSLAGFQKIITLTIIFGFRLWDAIDDLAMSLLKIAGIDNHALETVNLSLIIISCYILIHLIAGMFAGFIAIKIPEWVKEHDPDKIFKDFKLNIKTLVVHESNYELKKGVKKKYLKYTFTLIVLLFLVLSILFEQTISNPIQSVILISVRVILILFIWFKIISTLFTNLLLKMLSKTRWKQAEKVGQIISLFPHLNKIIHFCWQYTSDFKTKRTRFKKFLSYTLLLSLSSSNE